MWCVMLIGIRANIKEVIAKCLIIDNMFVVSVKFANQRIKILPAYLSGNVDARNILYVI